MTQFALYNDDCLNVLKTLDDNSIDSCVTDPPYGLSFMGKSWDYDVPSADIWREVLRVLKPGGHLLAFFGSRTYHRGVIQIEDAGFEIRDQIMWLYGTGFPKSGNLKPAHEPIVVARKPLDGSRKATIEKYGTGGLNIEESRVECESRPLREIAPLNPNVIYDSRSLSGRVDGSLQSSKAVGETNLGRWPANVIHDGSDEVVENFPESEGALAPVKGTEKSTTGQNGIYGHFDRVPSVPLRNDSGSAARFFYCAKASKSDRDESLEDFLAKKIVTFQTGGGASGKPSSISAGRNTAYKNNHPTVKPTELMKYLVKLVTQKNGTILDPFMGSGTTGKACGFEGFKFVGIERDADYFEIAKARIEHAYQNKTVNLENFFE